MKTKNILLVILGVFLTISSVNAEYKIYHNIEDFEKGKWAVCEAATDGCNNYFMNNGKVAWGTLMVCWNDFKPEWSCTKFKDNIMTTKMITNTDMEMISIENTSTKVLSENDQNFYNTIKNRLDTKYQNIVSKGVTKIELKLSQYSSVKADRVNKTVINRIETLISQLLIKYPQDIALPAKANNLYLTLTMLKFELMQSNY